MSILMNLSRWINYVLYYIFLTSDVKLHEIVKMINSVFRVSDPLDVKPYEFVEMSNYVLSVCFRSRRCKVILVPNNVVKE